MKLKTINMLRAFMILACLAFSFTSKAQSCTYVIDNQLTCTANVTIEWYENIAGSCVLCDSQTGPASGMTAFTCGCAPTAAICEVRVYLNSVGTQLFGTPPVVDSANTAAGPITLTGCPTSTTATMTWGFFSTTIN